MNQPEPHGVESMPRSEALAYVLDRYQSKTDYYWRASRRNKRGYTSTRTLTIVFGALVTLIASLSSAEFIESRAVLDTTFSVLTPVLAATLAIIGGFSQAFQFGAAWQEMVINATCLERERDRLKVLPNDQRDPVQELDVLNSLVLEETRNFFDRIVGVGRTDGGRRGQERQIVHGPQSEVEKSS